VLKANLIPAECAQLGDAQPVPVGDPDHGGIAVPVPVLLCGDDQALDFLVCSTSLYQVLAWSPLAAGTYRGRTVPFSAASVVAWAVALLIARIVQHTSNCPIPGRKWDSLVGASPEVAIP
jgi:hypothetical protein